jgi:capsular polysaccharide transport system ATP-binding protein
MIALQNISKSYKTRFGVKKVLQGANLTVQRGQKVGILGGNGAGKSTLIRLLGGVELPSSGKIIRSMSVSWPLAFSGGFQGSLTGLDNLRFISRVYGVSYEEALPFVESFSELGPYLREPLKTYSSGMRARLGFAISMAVNFDCFLIDEVTAVGDRRFHKRCHEELFEKRKDRALIFVSHQAATVRSFCDSAVVLSEGRLLDFDCMDAAFSFYESQQR